MTEAEKVVKDHDELYWGSFMHSPLHVQLSRQMLLARKSSKDELDKLPQAANVNGHSI